MELLAELWNKIIISTKLPTWAKTTEFKVIM